MPRLFSTFHRHRFTFAGFTLVLLLVSPLAAVDGVVEVNQAKAIAGGVTPGDTAGFPVIIDTPGSYRLTSNLAVSDVALTVIDVQAANVTLDLNGFAILGPVSCTYSEGDVTCTPDVGTGDGIRVRQGNFVVHDGVIRGMGRRGLVNFNTPQPDGVRVENVRVWEIGGVGIDFSATAEVSILGGEVARNRDEGIWLGLYGRVEGATVVQNGHDGISIAAGGRVEDTTSAENGLKGIVANGSSMLVRNNILDSNGDNGILLNGATTATVLGNRITNNGSGGVFTGTSGEMAYGDNVFLGNAGTITGPGAALEISINVCDGSTTCP